MQKQMVLFIAAAVMTGIAVPADAGPNSSRVTMGIPVSADVAPKKGGISSGLSEAEKGKIRKRSMEYCIKAHGARGSNQILRVQVLSDGRAICWMRI